MDGSAVSDMRNSGQIFPLPVAPLIPPPLRAFAAPAETALRKWVEPPELVDTLRSAAHAGDGAAFAGRLLQMLDIRFEVSGADLGRIPSTGATVVVANHPFGIVEGVILTVVLNSVRADYRIVANSLLSAITPIRDNVLLVNPFETAEAGAANRSPLRQCLRYLSEGGLLGLFPAGEVAHLNWEEHAITDPEWKTTAARLALRAGCPVVPVFFEGANSLSFQLAGAVHPQLRTLSLLREFCKMRGKTVPVRIGNAISASVLKTYADPLRATEYLRSRTFFLSNRPLPVPVHPQPTFSRERTRQIDPPASERLLSQEVAALPADRELLRSGEFSVYLAAAAEIPLLLREIGRSRERAFRQVGEGTGKEIDLDSFDSYYQHLFLWDRSASRLAGAYRLAATLDVLPLYGISGLYTSTLVHYRPRFFERLGPAVELGRSFVCPEYQKSYSPLLLLWKGIARFLQRRPESAVLFGAVSISRDYQDASRGLMATYLTGRAAHELADLVAPRNRFRTRVAVKNTIQRLAAVAADIDDVSLSISDIEADGKGIPVLLRQYLKAGGKLLAFNVDPKFSNAVDALILTDLRTAPPAMLERCMGKREAQAFLDRLAARRVQ